LELVGANDCTEVAEVVDKDGTVNLWAGRLNGKIAKITKRLTQFLPGAMDAEIIGVNKTLGRIRVGHKPNGPAYGKLIHKVVKNGGGWLMPSCPHFYENGA